MFYLHSIYYRNKLNKLQRETQKLGGQVSVFVPSGKNCVVLHHLVTRFNNTNAVSNL